MGSAVLVSRTGRYKIFPVVGTAVMMVGFVLLSRMDAATPFLLQSLYLFILGTGIGMCMQVLILIVLIVKNTSSFDDLGVATSGVTFFRTIGSSFGAAIFGSMFAIFASIALLLATCGLYAVTAYAVSRRTREIGVRVALGADARRVYWAVMGATVRQLAVGLVVGMAGAAAVATVLPAILVGTGGGSLLAFAVVAVVLVAAGLAASAVPARRAMRIDPMTALQTE